MLARKPPRKSRVGYGWSSYPPSNQHPQQQRHRHTRHKSSGSRFRRGGNGGNGFLLPRAKSHYAPDLRLVPTHLGTCIRFIRTQSRPSPFPPPPWINDTRPHHHTTHTRPADMAEIHLDLTDIARKTLKGAVTLTFVCTQPASGPGEAPLRKALLDAVAFSEVEVGGGPRNGRRTCPADLSDMLPRWESFITV